MLSLGLKAVGVGFPVPGFPVPLLELGQDVVEDVEEQSHVVLFEDQRRAEANGAIAAAPHQHSFVPGSEQDLVPGWIVSNVHSTERSLTSSATQQPRVLLL